MELKDNEYFLYEERTFLNLNSPREWKYAITSNKIMQNDDNHLGRVVGSLESVLDSVESPSRNLEKVRLLGNVFYRGDFRDDSDEYYQERGVPDDVIRSAVNILEDKGIESEGKIHDMSLRYFTSSKK